MPLYEYQCDECNETFEELVSKKDRDAGTVACPACGSTKVKRMLSTFAVGRAAAGSSAASCPTGTCPFG